MAYEAHKALKDAGYTPCRGISRVSANKTMAEIIGLGTGRNNLVAMLPIEELPDEIRAKIFGLPDWVLYTKPKTDNTIG